MQRTATALRLAALVSSACLASCGTEKEPPPTGLQVATDIERALNEYQRRLTLAMRVIRAETQSGSLDATELMDAMDAMELGLEHLDGDSPTQIIKDVGYIMDMYDGIEERDHHKLADSLSPHVRRVQERWTALMSVLDPPLKRIEEIASTATGAVPSIDSIVDAREFTEGKLDELVRDLGQWSERVSRAYGLVIGALKRGKKWDELPASYEQFYDASAPTIGTLAELVDKAGRLKVVVVVTAELPGLAEAFDIDAADIDEGELRRETNADLLRHLSETRTLRRQLEEIIGSVEPFLVVLEQELEIGLGETTGVLD